MWIKFADQDVRKGAGCNRHPFFFTLRTCRGLVWPHSDDYEVGPFVVASDFPLAAVGLHTATLKQSRWNIIPRGRLRPHMQGRELISCLGVYARRPFVATLFLRKF